jgi:hypothetical protein
LAHWRLGDLNSPSRQLTIQQVRETDYASEV